MKLTRRKALEMLATTAAAPASAMAEQPALSWLENEAASAGQGRAMIINCFQTSG